MVRALTLGGHGYYSRSDGRIFRCTIHRWILPSCADTRESSRFDSPVLIGGEMGVPYESLLGQIGETDSDLVGFRLEDNPSMMAQRMPIRIMTPTTTATTIRISPTSDDPGIPIIPV
ncbi:MAG: hypothetical protein AABZ47_16140 [Planctomycetota bacterium]